MQGNEDRGNTMKKPRPLFKLIRKPMTSEEELTVLADDLMRVEEHFVAGRVPRDEHLVADAGRLDDDVIGTARDDPAPDKSDHAAINWRRGRRPRRTARAARA